VDILADAYYTADPEGSQTLASAPLYSTGDDAELSMYLWHMPRVACLGCGTRADTLNADEPRESTETRSTDIMTTQQNDAMAMTDQELEQVQVHGGIIPFQINSLRTKDKRTGMLGDQRLDWGCGWIGRGFVSA